MSFFTRTYRTVRIAPAAEFHLPVSPWGTEVEADDAMALAWEWAYAFTGFYTESRRFGIRRIESGVAIVKPGNGWVKLDGTIVPNRTFTSLALDEI